MKNRTISSLGVGFALAAVCLAGCATRADYTELYGFAAPVGQADRTIVITPDMRYVNVEGGQTVEFVAGDKRFAWNFSVAGSVTSFSLNEVAPAGMLSHPVKAYVTPDPLYARL